MSCVVITNNPKSLELEVKKTEWVDGNAVAVLEKARVFILKGGQLVLDPMAGHLARPNHFLTIVIKPSPKKDYFGEDVLRLEYLINMYKHNWTSVLDSQSFSSRLLDDYSELDFSLAASGLQK